MTAPSDWETMNPTQETIEEPDWDDVTVGIGSTQEIDRPSNRARLIALAGPQAGRVYELDGQAEVGRHLEAAVRIDSSDVSRHHATIYQDPSGAWVIEDLGSRNGTLVNRAPLVEESRVLSYGDRIQFGSSCLFIFSHYDDLEQQILQSQRMEAVGRLAGGIVHDFNNVMTAIVGTADYLDALARDGRPVDSKKLVECLGDIKRASTRAIELTRGLLGFSGAQDASSAIPVSVSGLLREVAQLCRHAFPSNIRVELLLDDDLAVAGQETQLHQVLMNLCLNARDAMPDGGSLTLTVSELDLEGPSAPAIPFLTPGSYAMISAKDTGSGMDPEVARRAFEPFFTTKHSQQGTGLGLATAYGLVRNHGGYLQLESAKGRGTEARVYLPALGIGGADSPKRKSSPYGIDPQLDDEQNAPPKGTALVVDDEQSVLRSTRRLLSGLGWACLTAEDGREAIALMARRLEEIDLVLLDTVLPRLSGVQTYQILRRLAPHTPIVMMSGFDAQGASQAALADGANAFLPKPFDGKALQKMLYQLTGGLHDVSR